MALQIRYFNSATEFRGWLETNQATATELWVGFYKKGSGKSGLTYTGAVEEALCFGWIDGLKKRVDEFSYTHRFSPRKTRSNWSRINVQHAQRWMRTGRMAAAGLRAYASQLPERSDAYSYESAPKRLAQAYEKNFKVNKAAWKFFQRQPPGYQRVGIWWVMCAKKPETRMRRLEKLIEASHNQCRVGQLGGSKQKGITNL